MSDDETAASLLRRLRREHGRSLRSTASDLGMAPSQLSRIERGYRSLSQDLQDKMATYYGVSSDLVALAEGRVPDDVLTILRRHPEELQRLREEYSSRREGSSWGDETSGSES